MALAWRTIMKKKKKSHREEVEARRRERNRRAEAYNKFYGGRNWHYETYSSAMQRALAEARKVVARDGFPRETAVGDLDDDALQLMAAVMIHGWFGAQLDFATTTLEAQHLLARLDEFEGLDFGVPLKDWPREVIADLVESISEYLVETYLRNHYIWMARAFSLPWPLQGDKPQREEFLKQGRERAERRIKAEREQKEEWYEGLKKLCDKWQKEDEEQGKEAADWDKRNEEWNKWEKEFRNKWDKPLDSGLAPQIIK
jgi:hypothetical protein